VSLLSTLKDFFSSTVQTATSVATNFDQHWQNLVDLWARAQKDWETFLEGRELDELRIGGSKLTSLVITLRDAEDVMEEFRVGRLKEKIQNAYAQIKDAIQEIKLGPVDFSTSDPQAGEDVGPMAKLLVRLDDILNQIERILSQILGVAELFDFVTSAEKEMEAKILSQKKVEAKLKDATGRRTRNP
jgi:hypothetical protein